MLIVTTIHTCPKIKTQKKQRWMQPRIKRQRPNGTAACGLSVKHVSFVQVSKALERLQECVGRFRFGIGLGPRNKAPINHEHTKRYGRFQICSIVTDDHRKLRKRRGQCNKPQKTLTRGNASPHLGDHLRWPNESW